MAAGRRFVREAPLASRPGIGLPCGAPILKSSKVDVWAAGCVLYAMITGTGLEETRLCSSGQDPVSSQRQPRLSRQREVIGHFEHLMVACEIDAFEF